jgi:hypothetical protein
MLDNALTGFPLSPEKSTLRPFTRSSIFKMGEGRNPKESARLSLRAKRPKTAVEAFSQSQGLKKKNQG